MKSLLETLFEHSWVGVLLLCWYLMMHELKLHPLLLWALILFFVVVSMWGIAVFFFERGPLARVGARPQLIRTVQAFRPLLVSDLFTASLPSATGKYGTTNTQKKS